jgi:hypothetical protein
MFLCALLLAGKLLLPRRDTFLECHEKLIISEMLLIEKPWKLAKEGNSSQVLHVMPIRFYFCN